MAPPITQLEMTEADIVLAERAAKRIGYEQWAYRSTSGLWGLFCLRENPATWKGLRQALTAGCFIKTAEFGLMFVQGLDDLNLFDLDEKQKGKVAA